MSCLCFYVDIFIKPIFSTVYGIHSKLKCHTVSLVYMTTETCLLILLFIITHYPDVSTPSCLQKVYHTYRLQLLPFCAFKWKKISCSYRKDILWCFWEAARNNWDACNRLSNKMQLLSFAVQLLLKVCLTSKRQFSFCIGKSIDAYGWVALCKFEADLCR